MGEDMLIKIAFLRRKGIIFVVQNELENLLKIKCNGIDFASGFYPNFDADRFLRRFCVWCDFYFTTAGPES